MVRGSPTRAWGRIKGQKASYRSRTEDPPWSQEIGNNIGQEAKQELDAKKGKKQGGS